MESKNILKNSYLNKSKFQDEICSRVDDKVLEEIEKLNLKIEQLKNKIDNKIKNNLEKQIDKKIKETDYKEVEKIKSLYITSYDRLMKKYC